MAFVPMYTMGVSQPVEMIRNTVRSVADRYIGERDTPETRSIMATDVQAALDQLSMGMEWVSPNEVRHRAGLARVEEDLYGNPMITVDGSQLTNWITTTSDTVSISDVIANTSASNSEIESMKDEIQELKDQINELKMLLLEN